MNEGILLVDKAREKTAFYLVKLLRRLTNIKKIGHAGTLDPFATGLMVMLIGKPYTKQSDRLLTCDKEYTATVHLGKTTDTYDCDGTVTATSDLIPTLDQVEKALAQFSGTILQTPPMYSAKKVDGKKLYDLARQGITIERKAVPVTIETRLIAYTYPTIQLAITCSKGTYIRSLAHDLGEELGCGAHLSALIRTRSGPFSLEQAVSTPSLKESSFDLAPYLIREIPCISLAH